jgi:hypothetical protein
MALAAFGLDPVLIRMLAHAGSGSATGHSSGWDTESIEGGIGP